MATRPGIATKSHSTLPPREAVAALNNALLLGWEIVELRNRIRIALVEPMHFNLRLASTWRASFNRIATLQRTAFPDGATAKTLYEPPDDQTLPYLYHPEPDYANVGIRETDETGEKILAEFKLFDVTRRAINCLTLLYVDREESLIPALVTEYQAHLVAQVHRAARSPDAGGGEEVSLEGSVPQDRLESARSILTERTMRFLEAWEGYLRENYYLGGVIPSDNVELLAFEAGHSMASLSWGISAATVGLEQRSKDAAAAGQPQDDIEPFIDQWRDVFRDQAVIRLQHQITALSSELDDAYYLQHPERRRTESSPEPTAPDPDLPSHALQAVKRSIDFWHRAVNWIAENPQRIRRSVNRTHWNKRLRIALIEQANIWQSLVTGQQSLRAYNMESLTNQILQDATEEILASFQTDFRAGVQQSQEVVKGIMDEAREASVAAADNLKRFVGQSWRFWVPIAAFAVLGVALILFAALSTRAGGETLLGGVGSLVSSLLGYLGLDRLKQVNQKQEAAVAKIQSASRTMESQGNAGADQGAASGGLLSRLGDAAQDTGELVFKAFERGYAQIRIEMDGLNRSVAVTYPLIEYFGAAVEIKGDMAFLTEIIWSGTEREAEVKRVMHAAFGPLALFVSPGAPGRREAEAAPARRQIAIPAIAPVGVPAGR